MPYITFTRRIRLLFFELLWSDDTRAWYIRTGSRGPIRRIWPRRRDVLAA